MAKKRLENYVIVETGEGKNLPAKHRLVVHTAQMDSAPIAETGYGGTWKLCNFFDEKTQQLVFFIVPEAAIYHQAEIEPEKLSDNPLCGRPC